MLREKLGIKDEQITKEVEDARKAVYEKNKAINDLSNKLREALGKSEKLELELGKINYDK